MLELQYVSPELVEASHSVTRFFHEHEQSTERTQIKPLVAFDLICLQRFRRFGYFAQGFCGAPAQPPNYYWFTSPIVVRARHLEDWKIEEDDLPGYYSRDN